MYGHCIRSGLFRISASWDRRKCNEAPLSSAHTVLLRPIQLQIAESIAESAYSGSISAFQSFFEIDSPVPLSGGQLMYGHCIRSGLFRISASETENSLPRLPRPLPTHVCSDRFSSNSPNSPQNRPFLAQSRLFSAFLRLILRCPCLEGS